MTGGWLIAVGVVMMKGCRSEAVGVVMMEWYQLGIIVVVMMMRRGLVIAGKMMGRK